MQIKRLEIFGFKSFPRKVSIKFPPGISAIVGPNGSGKSNLVDALRWILGEQNPRLLRVREMAELIYAGENGFRPEFAEVRLILDNEAKDGPKELANLAEISVVRRLYRDGESEFFLNNKPCRLKDIVYLFIDSGVYARGYGIIDQGQVSQFIDQSPKERRKHLEQLAGISRYKLRREETEKQITKTQENLTRIKDILAEVEARLEELSKQAEEAKKYLSLQEELRKLEIAKLNKNYNEQLKKKEKLLVKKNTLEAKIKELREAIQQIEPKILEYEGKLGIYEEEQGRLEKELQKLEENYQLKRKELNSLFKEESLITKELSQLEGKISANKERQQKIKLRIIETKKEIDIIEKRLPKNENELSILNNKNNLISQEIEIKEQKLKSLESDLTRLRQELNQLKKEKEKLKSEIKAILLEKEKFDKNIETLEKNKEFLEEEIEQKITEKIDFEKNSKEVEQELKQNLELDKEIAEKIREIEDSLHELFLKRKEISREMSWLTSFIDRSIKEVVEILDKNKIDYEIALEQINLTNEEEKIVDSIYQDLTKTIILKKISDLPNVTDLLRQKGKKAVLFIGKNFNNAIKARVQKIKLVQNLNIDENNKEKQLSLFVKEQNILIEPDGFVFVLSQQREDLLKKKKILQALTKEKEKIELEIKEKENYLEDLQKEKKTLYTKIDLLSRQKSKLSKKIQELSKEIGLDQIKLEKINNKLEIIIENKEHLEQKIIKVEQALKEKNKAEDPLLNEIKNLEANIDVFKKEYEQEKKSQIEIEKKLRNFEIQVIKDKEQLKALKKELENYIREDKIIAQQVEKLLNKKDKLDVNWRQIKTKIKEVKNYLHIEKEKIDSIKIKIRDIRQEIENIRKNEKKLRSEIFEKNKELEKQERTLNKLEVDLAQVELTLAHLAEQAYQNFKIRLPLAGNDEAVSQQELEKKITTVKEALAKFGLINLAAIEELEKTKERERFLLSQKEDLEKALEDLRAAVKQINQTCRKRLKEALLAANEKLAEIFPVLFPEASAELRFTESEDPLEAGLDLIVKLPGKPIRHLSMLSGGEKALTALAVLCAFYLVKPGPFCILDEVDAPLDEANTEKFVKLLKKLTNHSQVILVTHNKRVMENADLLIGVTMEEKGISKIVSVSLS